MNHFVLFILCLLSVEIFFRSNYIFLINSNIKLIKKASSIILNTNISDHWKENIIPKYSMQIMKYSLQMLLIFSLIIFLFLVTDNFFNGFLTYTFSWNGIIKSLVFAFGYAYFKKIFVK